ncbi:MAG TPA: hypothetical protein VKB16_10865 [Beijerinckiaceae bacterium]|nr:hypothetical protein [Beijerinckiaceae bacterium]
MARHAFVGVPIEYSSSMSMPSKPEPVDRGDELVDEPLRRLLIRELGPSGVRPVVDDGQKHRDPQALQLFHIVGVIERGIDRQREGEHRDVRRAVQVRCEDSNEIEELAPVREGVAAGVGEAVGAHADVGHGEHVLLVDVGLRGASRPGRAGEEHSVARIEPRMAVEHQDAAAVEEETDIRVRPRNPLRRLRRAVRDGLDEIRPIGAAVLRDVPRNGEGHGKLPFKE